MVLVPSSLRERRFWPTSGLPTRQLRSTNTAGSRIEILRQSRSIIFRFTTGLTSPRHSSLTFATGLFDTTRRAFSCVRRFLGRRSQIAKGDRLQCGTSGNNTSRKTSAAFPQPRIGCARSSRNVGCTASVSEQEITRTLCLDQLRGSKSDPQGAIGIKRSLR